jgi:acetyl esterase/lipase
VTGGPQTSTGPRDLVYSVVPGYRPLWLDLHLPASGPPRAVCVYLHGGGWRIGSRKAGPGAPAPDSGRRFERMTAQGLAVASVDYRLSGEARFPAQRDDVAAACTYLDENREQLGLGGAPLVIWGVSAGGLLAALRALDADAQPAVAGAVCWYPVTDIAALPADMDAVGGAADRGPESREALLLGAPTSAVPDLARVASPVTHAHPAAPPFLLVHADADVDVPLQQSRRLADALQAVGAQATLETVPGEGHMFRTLAPEALDALIDRSVAFLLGRS